MLSKRVVAAARGRGLFKTQAAQAAVLSSTWRTTGSYVLRSQFHSTHLLQDEVVKVPVMAESISEGTLKTWKKKVGESVEADEEVASIETDKIDVSVNAPKAGKITELLVQEEDNVSVGQDLFKYEPGAAGEPSEKPAEEPKPREEPKEQPPKEEPKEQPPKKEAPPPPAPKESEKQPSKPAPPPPKPQEPKSKDEGKAVAAASARAPGSRNETRVKMSRMRLRIAERLKESQNAAASLTTFNEIDMSALMAMRSRFKDSILKEHEVKLGFMSAFAKASCLALKEIPTANASIEGDEIVYRDYVDLSVAVATPKGLVTPVVRNAEQMGFIDVEKEIAALGKKARDGKLTIEDMAGGTFTISNGGVFGSLYGTPIINLPQAAVLGMHAIKEKPVVVNGEIVIRPIMVVALTYDHRLLDGREAVTFLVKIRDYIEDPLKMLLP
ncbi:dihydrolipoyllysine-residue succinyltransferase 1 [Fomitiporia mediterranea MF3/22]|uniref:dihydrolipoyllysine-residue succinyltransferase 1 n=1 Tax=Fomitiporia mediterranea (strain MF3/22) TaxID=694068 RepID=UPI00044080E7|nr:dihydrolipoyllysine-residue succinyltransferase 1 [Fomitiporia mediterranea MF3/22]EJC98259.1 dihydrolipoyllysine-residue succinyltransferase 1 [Fomitiporia mediterranea MF3/22]